MHYALQITYFANKIQTLYLYGSFLFELKKIACQHMCFLLQIHSIKFTISIEKSDSASCIAQYFFGLHILKSCILWFPHWKSGTLILNASKPIM